MSYNYSLLFAEISKRLAENPRRSIAQLASELGISRRTIQHIVSAQSGRTFNAIRDEILLIEVRRLFVSEPQLAIKEVCFALGFSSPRSFGRVLKRVSGVSPEKLRSTLTRESLLQEGTSSLVFPLSKC